MAATRCDSTSVQDAIDREYGDATELLPQPYEEIKKLIKIERSPICGKALEEWSRKELLFSDRVQRAKAEVARLKSEIYQFVGYYIAFQGFLFNGVMGSNLLHCNNVSSPISLSVFVSFVAIAGVLLKAKQIGEVEKVRFSEDQFQQEMTRRLTALRRDGVDDFKFAEFHEYSAREGSTLSKSELFVYWAVVGCLVILTVYLPYSYWRILCHPGENPYH